MPTCLPRTSRADTGFTLIEMLVVLTIIGLVSAAGATIIGRKPASLARAEVIGRIRAAAATAATAAREGRAQPLDLHTIPTKAGTLTFASSLNVAPTLVFYPDGSATGGTIALDGRPLATVDWLTGAVADAAP